MGEIELVRTVTFSSAHRYYSPGLTEAENRQAYGSLYRDEGFGHNFLLEAHFTGPVDPLTGMIANLVDIDTWLKSVASRFDHKMLNETPEFLSVAPTLERIAKVFFELLKGEISAASSRSQVVKVRIFEGDQTWVDYRG